MVRSVLVGIALMFSFLSAASADVLPNPVPRNRVPAQCACFRAPCDCDRIIRMIEERGDQPVLTNCSAGDFRPAHLGSKGICYYSNVFCDAYRDSSTKYTRAKGITAYCLPARNGDCPDSEECVNTDDVKPSDFSRVTLDAVRTGDTSCEEPERSRPSTPANPQRSNR